jgi:PAS domain S-box-containing protein
MVEYTGVPIEQLGPPDADRFDAMVKAIMHPDDAIAVTNVVQRATMTGEAFSLKHRLHRSDGVHRWVEARAEPMRDAEGAIVQWYGVYFDIDGQMHAEQSLRQSEQQLQQLADTVPVQIWCVTPTGEPAYINKTMMDYIGMKLEDFEAEGGLRSAIQTIVHPDDRDALFGTLSHSFRTGEPFALRFRNRRGDGVYRWQEGRADPLRDDSGQIIRWYGVNVDIDDLLATQEALRERERFLWQLVETLPAMIDCAAPNGEPVYRSRQLREFLGYNLEELDGTGKSRLSGTLDAGVHPDDLAGVKEKYAHSLSTGEPYARRHRLRRFDGEYRWVETRAGAMRNGEGAIVQWNVICLDIDGEVRAQEELRLAQERLARASQAASLAELSASIAHEVNQPLAAIIANSHACQRWLTAEPPNIERAHRTVERIIRDANGAADVVSRIRALFRQSLETRSSTALGSIIAEVRDLMAEEAARRSVRMVVEVESGLPPVVVDRIQVQQVLINLIRNGIEAMESVGVVRILRARVRRVAEVVQTEISDCGRGIERPDRIFEPFFTTKEHGMGMGLAICRSIIESHGGRLWAEKNEPPGATFVFTLPVEAKGAA